jgi:hypothetical protein
MKEEKKKERTRERKKRETKKEKEKEKKYLTDGRHLIPTVLMHGVNHQAIKRVFGHQIIGLDMKRIPFGLSIRDKNECGAQIILKK